MPPTTLLVSLLLACSVACTPHSRAPAPAPAPSGRPVRDDLLQALRLPPSAQAAEALRALARGPKPPACEPGWLRALYLIDLFDWVRLAPHTALSADRAHQLLWQGLALPGQPGRGRTATALALQELSRQLQQLAPSCQQYTWVQQALALLAADQAPRRTHEQAITVATTYKRLARSASPLAQNAALRLWDWCAAGFRLAAGGDPAQQHARLLQCLYPLYDADPAPYFSGDPAQRPPDPPWHLLAQKLPDLLASPRAGRLAPLAEALAAGQRRFLKLAQASLPTPLNLSRLSLIQTQAGSPWDRTPVLLATPQGFIIGGRALLASDLEPLVAAIQSRLHNDPRGKVTLVTAGSTPAEHLLAAGRLARRAGASTLALGVRRQVAARTVPGDVQQEVFGPGPVYRLEELPLSLQLLAPAGGANVRRQRPVGLSYDQRTGEHQLAIHIAGDGCRLSSVHGVIPALPCADLLEPLAGLRQVYPDDASLILSPAGSAPVERLISIAAQLLSPASRSRFMGLALGSPGLLTPPDRNLTELVTLVRQAAVTLDSAENSSWLPLLQRCYLQVLRSSWSAQETLPQGSLRLRATSRGLQVQPGTLRQSELQRCLKQTLPPPATTGTFIANFVLNGVR